MKLGENSTEYIEGKDGKDVYRVKAADGRSWTAEVGSVTELMKLYSGGRKNE